MKVLSFRLHGKMAHFRKYYSNSSALSYSIPPRTTVVGMVAGLLGLPKDSYYEQFRLDQCDIAIASRAPIKKIMQKLNLLMIKSLATDSNGSKGFHSQCATELVLPQNIRTGMLDYQVWLHHRDAAVMERLEHLLGDFGLAYGSRGISLALGSAANLGWITFDGTYTGKPLAEFNGPIASVMPLDAVRELTLPTAQQQMAYRLVKEDVPLEFDGQRKLTQRGKHTMLINLHNGPVYARTDSAVQLDDDQTIVWMK